MVGVSHHDVPLPVLDELSRLVDELPAELVAQPHAGVDGAVLLSTCNRVEVYLEAGDTRRAADAVRDLLIRKCSHAAPDVDFPRPRLADDVARHLFAVAAGLDSMVVGEDEIAGQVRRALTQARAAGTTSPSLERLFQSASSASKQVSSSTGLGAAGRSIVSVALDLVEQEQPLSGKPALLIGTGSFARVAYASLGKRGMSDVMVFSMSGRARRFVETHGGEAITQAGLIDALGRAELVVSCSGAPHPVLDARTLESVTLDRQSPLPVLDLALTQDVDDDARGLASVRVIDLEVISRHVPSEHGDAYAAAQRIVNEAVRKFGLREDERSSDAAVVALRGHVLAILEREQARAHARLDVETSEAVAHALHRFAGELLHEPTIRARQLSREGAALEFESALRTVFGIDTER